MKTHKGITLIGMPASGKSTLGSKLAERLGFGLLDVDAWMEAEEGMPLPQLILAKGREHVLSLEGACIQQHDLHDMVVSTPGSVIYGRSFEALRSQTMVFLLEVSLTTLEQRLAYNTENQRGIIGLKQGGLADLYAARMPLYHQWAHYTLHADRTTVDALVNEIVEIYERGSG